MDKLLTFPDLPGMALSVRAKATTLIIGATGAGCFRPGTGGCAASAIDPCGKGRAEQTLGGGDEQSGFRFQLFANYGPRRHAIKRTPATNRPLKLVGVAPAEVAQARGAGTPKRALAAIAALSGAATLLHVGLFVVLGQSGPAPAPLAKAAPIAIDLAPPPPPPPPPEPPKPQPQVAKVPTPAPAKAPPPPLPVVAEASDGPADADTVQVATTPQPPVPPAPAPAPPPPPAPEPVTEPRGYAGYLKNPPPEYPLAAQERGMQGKVVLKVHVLATGKPDSVTVDQTSGFKILDDSAVKAVLAWSFDPAKRGSTPIDGWVKVPLSFKL